jgi:hypothetical protein
MSCANIYDFLNYPAIRFPNAAAGRSGERLGWDILRPNRQADALVAEHLKALNALNNRKSPNAGNH